MTNVAARTRERYWSCRINMSVTDVVNQVDRYKRKRTRKQRSAVRRRSRRADAGLTQLLLEFKYPPRAPESQGGMRKLGSFEPREVKRTAHKSCTTEGGNGPTWGQPGTRDQTRILRLIRYKRIKANSVVHRYRF